MILEYLGVIARCRRTWRDNNQDCQVSHGDALSQCPPTLNEEPSTCHEKSKGKSQENFHVTRIVDAMVSSDNDSLPLTLLKSGAYSLNTVLQCLSELSIVTQNVPYIQIFSDVITYVVKVNDVSLQYPHPYMLLFCSSLSGYYDSTRRTHQSQQPAFGCTEFNQRSQGTVQGR